MSHSESAASPFTPDVASLRQTYSGTPLLEHDVSPDPIAQFTRWLDEALRAQIPEPHAMTLSTVSATGKPHARVVLLRDVGPQGVTFFTNYQSQKGGDLRHCPEAVVSFFWSGLARQVKMEGTVHAAPASVSDAYFASRPRDHQLGAWASQQSQTTQNRDQLAAAMREVEARFTEQTVPRPPHWGGYVLLPELVEFWQGQPSRLHDRLVYKKRPVAEGWTLERLFP